MQVLILAALTGAAAAAVWLSERGGKRRPPPEADRADHTDHAAEIWDPEAVGRLAEELSAVLDALRTVMEHPRLGGPGFLAVQFPLSGHGCPEASAQYPNIREELYRRIIRGELENPEGIPAELLARGIQFAAESGGMVLLTVPVPAEAAVEQMLSKRGGRQEVLGELAAALGRRYPDLTVRSAGADLILTPAARTF